MCLCPFDLRMTNYAMQCPTGICTGTQGSLNQYGMLSRK
jgi:hypothetical protein